MDSILFLSAPLIERIWGSNYFKDELNRTDKDTLYGEMWSVSALSEASSIILNGTYKDKTLKEVYENNPSLFNNALANGFPILIKIIATSDDLSVQVHPDDDYANKVENQNGKTEGWLILKAKENSQIVLGHNAKNKQELINYINNDDYDNLLNKTNVKVGEFYPIPSGTIHALGKDIVLIEIQQSSDVTYRFFDYHRKDKFGNERQLHVDKAIDVTSYKKYDENIINCFDSNVKTIWDNKYFKVDLYDVNNQLTLNNTSNYLIVSVIEGNIKVNDKSLSLGDSFIVTHNCKSFSLTGNGKIIITESKI